VGRGDIIITIFLNTGVDIFTNKGVWGSHQAKLQLNKSQKERRGSHVGGWPWLREKI